MEKKVNKRRLKFININLLKKVKKHKDEKRRGGIRVYQRASVIIPEFVGITFDVYNGKKMIPVHVTELMVGRKFGEFSPTRTFNGHGSNRK
ncbi:30S ribosomal protein S19 [Lyticum sinuosum]|uniref:Small ribosomal subunit protein uS19 n=1 Tax=Lyticum sinuosum TaxID=1332059 RepID=A0AAE4VLT4_9RICK|nr:30S ribosomal protein S19 [Lyticum sinuosum]MDZ5761186.1 30S ribosomal protein S19 [Lyticum sinuosum]